MADPYARLLELFGEIRALEGVMNLLEWDQEVVMPPRGVEARAAHRSTVAALMHDKLVAPELGDVLGEAMAGPAGDDPWRAADLRELKRLRDRAVRVPRRLVAELAHAGSLAQKAWAEARDADDWSRFAPHLSRLTDLRREEADAVGWENERYDALLDVFEPGARAAELEALFTTLREHLVPVLEALREAPRPPEAGPWLGSFATDGQDRLARAVLEVMGYDFTAGRLDTSAHPFTQGTGPGDVRITTRYEEGDLRTGLYAALHEGGHALYEQGLPADRAQHPAGGAVSLGIHESQSRLWENAVGRGRPFLGWLQPKLAEIWPDHFRGVSPDALYRAANTVQPSLIRIEADEVTYNLHIILRMEIERALVAGEVTVDDLPALWRDKVDRYLGLAVPTDREGVLQDIHWSLGLFGYFPTYALGNLYAAQFHAAAREQMPDLDDRLARGDTAGLLDWLRRNVHEAAALYPASELCVRVTGKPLAPDAFLGYVREKFGAVYGVTL